MLFDPTFNNQIIFNFFMKSILSNSHFRFNILYANAQKLRVDETSKNSFVIKYRVYKFIFISKYIDCINTNVIVINIVKYILMINKY